MTRRVSLESSSYHLVDVSPYPFMVSSGVLLVASALVAYMTKGSGGLLLLLLGLVWLIGCVSLWFRDIIREGTYEGQHTALVLEGFRLGMILFICSEVLFFFGFFVGYFWLLFGPGVEIGSVYPSVGITRMLGTEIPLLNTVILLCSGCSITYAHHGMLIGDRKSGVEGLVITVVLACIFTLLQWYEYQTASFNISDSVYGSLFYMLTGFHGLHVIIGSVMVGLLLVRVCIYEGSRSHHCGFESAAVYWHFVDVVWLVLYVVVYIW